MRHSIEPRYRKYVKGYEFLSFSRDIVKNVGKNIKSKYSQKLVDTAKKSATDAIKTASKTAQATGDLIVNKIAE